MAAATPKPNATAHSMCCRGQSQLCAHTSAAKSVLSSVPSSVPSSSLLLLPLSDLPSDLPVLPLLLWPLALVAFVLDECSWWLLCLP